ncbi:hypothetical protein J2736_005304 [Paenibacillus qinlingensis]|uniref:Uncharacterized protein n=1 Tax=Paenibacillus qinlingensis TaxID=1837343 RepID=A0ABU1P3G0_9BACL|nr:hypothetical protein [Paenibacillus qinlingensis]
MLPSCEHYPLSSVSLTQAVGGWSLMLPSCEHYPLSSVFLTQALGSVVTDATIIWALSPKLSLAFMELTT